MHRAKVSSHRIGSSLFEPGEIATSALSSVGMDVESMGRGSGRNFGIRSR